MNIKPNLFLKGKRKKFGNKSIKNNPDVYHSLLNAREGFRQVQDKITKIFIAFDSTDSKEIAKVQEEKEKLYLYWKEAGLPGDPVQIFQDYLKNHPYKYLDFEEYDYEKVPLDNNRTSRNNMILKLIQGRLQDPETLAARLTPGRILWC